MKIGLFDAEANGFLHQATKVHCGAVKQFRKQGVKQFRPHEVKEFLAYLETFDVLIAHNGIGYDFPLLKKLYGWEFKGKIVDSLIMSRLLDPKRLLPPNCPNRKTGPHSIEAWGWRVGRGKPEHNDWENFSEEMMHRCSEDVEILELVVEALFKESEGYNWKPAFNMSFELFTNLQQQEEYGWKVDLVRIDRYIKQLTRYIAWIDRIVTPLLPNVLEIEESKKEGIYNYVKKPFLKSGKVNNNVSDWAVSTNCKHILTDIVGPFSRIRFRKTNLDSNEEVKDFLLEQGWEPLEWNTDDDGNRSSAKLSKDDPFEGVEGSTGRLVARRVQCRQRRGIIEGLRLLVREDGRIASVVNTLAVTGRATHRNIVNIPKASSFFGKQMRRIFTSGEGYVLVGCDSAGNQLRQLAARMDNPVYTKALIEGKKEDGSDNHSLTRDIGELESRDIAKNVMYCLLFGGGDAKLAKTAKKPAGTGADLRAKLYRGLDGLGTLMERLTTEWRSTAKRRYSQKFRKFEYYDGIITGLDGRPIRVASEHQLLVYLLQSDEAIHMAVAYNILCANLRKKYQWGVDYGVVCWYHDEYTIECKEEIAEDVKQIAEEAIAEAGRVLGIKCPHEGDGAIGKNWYSIH